MKRATDAKVRDSIDPAFRRRVAELRAKLAELGPLEKLTPKDARVSAQLAEWKLRGIETVLDEDAYRRLMFAAQDLIANVRLLTQVLPAMELGQKFMDGRKVNTGGPIRKAIARLLKKNPAMKNPELWAAVTAMPPRGWTVYGDRKYLEGPGVKNMSQGRFFTVCGEERKKNKR